MKKLNLSLLIFFAAATPVLANDDITGKVTTVIDGNTVEVLGDDNEKHKVILTGIDCPELTQAFGENAKRHLEKMILNKKVVVKFKGKDTWGNRLAIVLIKGETDPRIDLLKEGLAWTSERNPDPALENLRICAQEKGKGLWKEPTPTPPWTYRREQTMMEAKSS